MSLPEGRDEEDIGLFLNFLVLHMLYFLGYLGSELAEEVVTIRSDTFDRHEVDEWNILCVGLLLVLEVLVDVFNDRS